MLVNKIQSGDEVTLSQKVVDIINNENNVSINTNDKFKVINHNNSMLQPIEVIIDDTFGKEITVCFNKNGSYNFYGTNQDIFEV